MSELQVDKEVSARKQQQSSSANSNSSASSSPSASLSIIKLDELSSFGATKQGRLPTLIKLNLQEENRQPHSMPDMDGQQIEAQASPIAEKQQSSLPAQLKLSGDIQEIKTQPPVDKENLNESEDFQMVDMVSSDLLGPSLPQPSNVQKPVQQKELTGESLEQQQRNVLASLQQSIQYPSHLGDSLIEMIINLRNENQSLVRALETNNDYVKERINEFKRYNEEAKKREAKFALEKADQEHQVRKLQRQNTVLSERLKSMEAKLKDMKLEVGETLVAAHSSKASSLRDGEQPADISGNLYPNLMEGESFSNSALNQATTMQMDATSGELYVNNGVVEQLPVAPPQPPMDTEPKSCEASGSGTASAAAAAASAAASRVAAMSREELAKHFDSEKVDFYALDDPMKQCDKLEQQLNDIGKRDYEICLLQQQLNIYRQDYRLERMANLDAKIQIERLKNDIDRLCYERLVEKNAALAASQEKIRGGGHGSGGEGGSSGRHHSHLHRGSHHRSSGGVRFSEPVAAAADAVMSKLGHQLSKKAARSAAKAAKYASKQAYKEEKRIAAAAAAAAASAASSSGRAGETASSSEQQQPYQHGHRRHHSHGRPRGIGSEVVSDLLSTANKAMLTGYKMASTQVNLALDKLSAYEQQQASNLAANRPPVQQQHQQQTPQQPPKASAPPAGLSSLD